MACGTLPEAALRGMCEQTLMHHLGATPGIVRALSAQRQNRAQS